MIQHLKEQRTVGCPFVFATQTGKYPELPEPAGDDGESLRVGRGRASGLHAFRHSFASNLYARGVSVKVISKLLGHSSTQITIDRYVHLFEEDIDDTLQQAVGA